MTLKPAAWMCSGCNDDVAIEKDVGCINCHYKRGTNKPTEPLFTRDDLVQMVVEAFAVANHPHVDGKADALVAEMLGEVES